MYDFLNPNSGIIKFPFASDTSIYVVFHLLVSSILFSIAHIQFSIMFSIPARSWSQILAKPVGQQVRQAPEAEALPGAPSWVCYTSPSE